MGKKKLKAAAAAAAAGSGASGSQQHAGSAPDDTIVKLRAWTRLFAGAVLRLKYGRALPDWSSADELDVLLDILQADYEMFREEADWIADDEQVMERHLHRAKLRKQHGTNELQPRPGSMHSVLHSTDATFAIWHGFFKPRVISALRKMPLDEREAALARMIRILLGDHASASKLVALDDRTAIYATMLRGGVSLIWSITYLECESSVCYNPGSHRGTATSRQWYTGVIFDSVVATKSAETTARKLVHALRVVLPEAQERDCVPLPSPRANAVMLAERLRRFHPDCIQAKTRQNPGPLSADEFRPSWYASFPIQELSLPQYTRSCAQYLLTPDRGFVLISGETHKPIPASQSDQPAGDAAGALVDAIAQQHTVDALTHTDHGILSLLDRLNLPFQLSEQERKVISVPGNTLLVGRSGTGKTTCAVLRLWSRCHAFQQHVEDQRNQDDQSSQAEACSDGETAADAASCRAAKTTCATPSDGDGDAADLDDETPGAAKESRTVFRAVFVTLSPILKNQVKTYYHALVKADMTNTTDADVAAGDGVRVVGGTAGSDAAVYTSAAAALASPADEEFSLGGDDDDAPAADDLVDDDDQQLHSLTAVPEAAFPLFLTLKKLLYMLDATLIQPFFARDATGAVLGMQDNTPSWHGEGGGLVQIARHFRLPDKGDATVPALPDDDDDEDGSDSDDDAAAESAPAAAAAAGSGTRRDVIESSREVDYSFFVQQLWPSMHRAGKGDLRVHPSLVYTEIMSQIKGSVDAIASDTGYLSLEQYEQLGRKRTPIPSETPVTGAEGSATRAAVYAMFVKYQSLKAQQKAFDAMDLVHHIARRMRIEGGYRGPALHNIVVDEVQDWNQGTLYLLFSLCQTRNGFFMTGDTCQTIARGIGFRFSDLQSLFHQRRTSSALAQQQVDAVPDVLQLTRNYRSTRQLVDLGHSLVDLLERLFPHTIDKLARDHGLASGPMPVVLPNKQPDQLFRLLTGQDGKTSTFIEFGAEQVVIVRAQQDKARLPPELQHALCMTVYECKGLEFADVIIYNFFADSPASPEEWAVISALIDAADVPLAPPADTSTGSDADAGVMQTSMLALGIAAGHVPPSAKHFDPARHSVLCSELKQLYTAVTRAKRRVFILDTDEARRQPILRYWLTRRLVSTRDDVVSDASAIARSTSPADWRRQGLRLLQRGFHQQASKCFGYSGDDALRCRADAFHAASQAVEAEAKAATLPRGKAGRAQRGEAETVAAQRYEEAAQLFLRAAMPVHAGRALFSAGKVDRAIQLFVETQQWQRAGQACVAQGQHAQAAEYFGRAGNWPAVVDAYDKAQQPRECVNVLIQHGDHPDFGSRDAARDRAATVYVPQLLHAYPMLDTADTAAWADAVHLVSLLSPTLARDLADTSRVDADTVRRLLQLGFRRLAVPLLLRCRAVLPSHEHGALSAMTTSLLLIEGVSGAERNALLHALLPVDTRVAILCRTGAWAEAAAEMQQHRLHAGVDQTLFLPEDVVRMLVLAGDTDGAEAMLRRIIVDAGDDDFGDLATCYADLVYARLRDAGVFAITSVAHAGADNADGLAALPRPLWQETLDQCSNDSPRVYLVKAALALLQRGVSPDLDPSELLAAYAGDPLMQHAISCACMRVDPSDTGLVRRYARDAAAALVRMMRPLCRALSTPGARMRLHPMFPVSAERSALLYLGIEPVTWMLASTTVAGASHGVFAATSRLAAAVKRCFSATTAHAIASAWLIAPMDTLLLAGLDLMLRDLAVLVPSAQLTFSDLQRGIALEHWCRRVLGQRCSHSKAVFQGKDAFDTPLCFQDPRVYLAPSMLDQVLQHWQSVKARNRSNDVFRLFVHLKQLRRLPMLPELLHSRGVSHDLRATAGFLIDVHRSLRLGQAQRACQALLAFTADVAADLDLSWLASLLCLTADLLAQLVFGRSLRASGLEAIAGCNVYDTVRGVYRPSVTPVDCIAPLDADAVHVVDRRILSSLVHDLAELLVGVSRRVADAQDDGVCVNLDDVSTSSAHLHTDLSFASSFKCAVAACVVLCHAPLLDLCSVATPDPASLPSQLGHVVATWLPPGSAELQWIGRFVNKAGADVSVHWQSRDPHSPSDEEDAMQPGGRLFREYRTEVMLRLQRLVAAIVIANAARRLFVPKLRVTLAPAVSLQYARLLRLPAVRCTSGVPGARAHAALIKHADQISALASLRYRALRYAARRAVEREDPSTSQGQRAIITSTDRVVQHVWHHHGLAVLLDDSRLLALPDSLDAKAVAAACDSLREVDASVRSALREREAKPETERQRRRRVRPVGLAAELQRKRKGRKRQELQQAKAERLKQRSRR